MIKNLLLNREFDKEGSIEQRAQKYEEHSNPIKHYIQEQYIKDETSSILFWKFYEGFSDYLKKKGMRQLSKKQVSHELEQEGYETEKDNYNDNGIWKKYVYIRNMRLKVGLERFGTHSTDSTDPHSDPHYEKPNAPSVLSVLTVPNHHDNITNEYTCVENSILSPVFEEEILSKEEEFLRIIDVFDDGNGAVWEILMEKSKVSNEFIKKCIENGVIFEPKPGFLKVVR